MAFFGSYAQVLPGRDLPETYGPRTTCYNRFVRWPRYDIRNPQHERTFSESADMSQRCPTRTEVANAVAASLRKPCFAEAVDIQPKPQYIAPPYPFRNAKIGFQFEQIGHCLPRLCFAS